MIKRFKCERKKKKCVERNGTRRKEDVSVHYHCYVVFAYMQKYSRTLHREVEKAK